MVCGGGWGGTIGSMLVADVAHVSGFGAQSVKLNPDP